MMKVFALLIVFGSLAYSTQYHATPSGEGAKTGADSANAWSFTTAMDAVAGDTVTLYAGTYPYIFSANHSGTSGSPIVFKAAAGQTVTLTGTSDSDVGVVYFWGSYVELHGIVIVTAENPAYDADYVIGMGGSHNVLRKCELSKSGDIMDAYTNDSYRTRGIALSGTYNIIDSCYIRGMNEGIVLHGGSPRYHTIRADTIHASVNNGIICGGTNDGSSNWMGVLIESCVIDTCYGEDGIQWQQGTDPYSVEKNKGYIVRNNYIANCYENLTDLKGASYVVIEGNVLHTSNSDDDGLVNGAEDYGTGPALERGETGHEDWFTVYRNNVLWDGGAGGVTISHGTQFVNNTLANNRRHLTTSNYTDTSDYRLRHVYIEGSNTYPRSILNNIFVGQSNFVSVGFYNMNSRTSILTMDNNIHYDSVSTATRFNYATDDPTSERVYGLSEWQSVLAGADYSYILGGEAHSLEADPTFVDFPLRPYGYNAAWDWTLDTGSPGIDAGRCWTFASGSGSGSAALVIDNPYFFTDGFGIIDGDSIMVDATARMILSINYSTSTLTLSDTCSWSDNDSVWYVSAGARLDNVGAGIVPAADTSGDPGAAPSTPTNLAPANGSTTTSPVTFRWSKPSGAVNYWLCVSPDEWGTLVVNQSALTDTFYTVSLSGGGSYVWNVAAGNTYGWSDWSADSWAFTTSQSGIVRDTVSLSWNSASHYVTVDTVTQIEFADLKRRDIMVFVSNAESKEVYWSDVTWRSSQPPTILPAESWFVFARTSGDVIRGAYMNDIGLSTVTWTNIVGDLSGNAALKAELDAIKARLTALENP